jgi:SEC-C motif-containing protein
MRSRYSAFYLDNPQYLSKTHHSSQRRKDSETSLSADIQWHGLTVVSSDQGQDHGEGYVEFIAHYSENQIPGLLHEKSRFVKENEQWFYIDGEIVESGAITLPSRNEPCWCDSGKKFKKCHG